MGAKPKERAVHPRELVAIGIGEKYHGKTLDDFCGTTYVRTRVLSYMRNMEKMRSKGVGLFLHGDMASGKFLLANLVAMSALARGYSVFVSSIADLVQARMSQYKTDDVETEEPLADFKKTIGVDVLVITDLCGGLVAGAKNAVRTMTLFDILRHRDTCMLPTTLTSRCPVHSKRKNEETIETLFNEEVAHLIRMNCVLIDCVTSLSPEELAEKREEELDRMLQQ